MKLGVIFNVPNTIGYFRIGLLVASVFASGPSFVALYGLSSLLDFFDGHFARMLNQCSLLGSSLDMITDRVSTVVISLRIIQKRSEYLYFLSLYMVFDLISHFIYFHMSALLGKHHKGTKNRILRIYYDKRVLGPICLLSEVFFMYAYYFGGKGALLYTLGGITTLKALFHLAQLSEAISSMSDIIVLKNNIQGVD
ncbi:CDP-diacylglycerol insitol-3-phosphatidyltransferase-like protein [Encephalitozoon hellem ATCC 50504]|uniref:CDP-alcohol phosphatidyltransferase n=1 Tax=Encephalitozoon hellem TaxID=27973 RepID=A0A9Q9C8R1_ENCHE|nr:CDP-diacylglycerol inositol-3-phosphatidyltransferase-like protein [Encephalitozoon hellem ATCC 50504]AFM97711.1 CDP-diacylglycerol insitol-3-phosphatidyltransferase-like protein [Encephalitozoon hellem ATCC 50504]UTX42403.1 putative CDP-alcohol phosphatidyltransferase [Encephalitozoon hellem]WEL37845.1 putative CDP-alcohol phosphatidyltransferase [Encephalitozoon hellem]|eukprot:XP_003886692.1 CDP-diacylglycerol inositol-3-phosphatidyltransferase-like protein [Encephalitozoon hellem ATCC 50504]